MHKKFTVYNWKIKTIIPQSPSASGFTRECNFPWGMMSEKSYVLAIPIYLFPVECWASLIAQLVKNLPAVQETQV